MGKSGDQKIRRSGKSGKNDQETAECRHLWNTHGASFNTMPNDDKY